MFSKILIANRGEIAVRIIRAAKELNIKTVAVYSTADKDSLHVQIADEAICIGGPKSNESYLNMQNIIQAAVSTGAEAIHPGYGFLSENATFAKLCKECNITFIGPDEDAINNMGNKAKAREMMINANVPVVPGSESKVDSVEEAMTIANEIGYPVLIKASAGGGGRGMRLAYSDDEFENAYQTAKSEAKVAFGDDTVYLEKFVENPRHIEFQILADSFGNVVHLFERDCSIQRRNQKMIEEAPSAILNDELRSRMGEAAIKAAKSVNYRNAGTIEFLVDKNNDFYFIEMNTRIQVEHPITEMITGVDLIKEQFKIAYGEKLSFNQDDISVNGHAIECRINAEDPDNYFAPSPGKVNFIHMPGGLGVRVDSLVYNGYSIPPTYDSMVGKLIVHGKNRDEAINKMKMALSEMIVDGVKTNIEFQYEIMNNQTFNSGNFDTGFIMKEYKQKVVK